MKPKAHVFRSRGFRTNLVAWIFYIGTDALQMCERFSQRRHVWQMERHMIKRFRRWLSFKQRDRDILVADCDAIFEIEFFPQSKRALEPFRAFVRIAYGQTKVSNLAECERNFHMNC